MQGQIALSLTGKFPGSLAAPHCSLAGGHITGIFHENSKKHISTALLLMLQFLHQRTKVLKHYKEMDLENVSNMSYLSSMWLLSSNRAIFCSVFLQKPCVALILCCEGLQPPEVSILEKL